MQGSSLARSGNFLIRLQNFFHPAHFSKPEIRRETAVAVQKSKITGERTLIKFELLKVNLDFLGTRLSRIS